MYRNYVKTAVRNLIRHKGHAAINALGLALGMACCFLGFLFIRHELSYDGFHEKRDRIYSLYIQETKPDGSLRNRRLIPLGVPEALAREFPAVTEIVQLAAGSTTVIQDGQPFRQDLFEADPSFFDVFSFPILGRRSSNRA
ncbi:ABC transporter permease [bacterium]|nr:ABC transporter permease [bacterium]